MKGRARREAGEPYQQILHRLAAIEHKVDSIDETNAFALRAEADKHQETVSKIFKKSRRRAQIYLAADGSRGVAEIAHHLGMQPQNVSRELGILKDEGLLELVDAPGRQDFWRKKSIDRTLRISRYLCEAHNLMLGGRPKPREKKGNRQRSKG